jgi:hypothetical protein
MHPLTKIRIAAFIVAGLAPDIQTAHPADLPLKPKHSPELVIDRSPQRGMTPAAKEILFQQFLEWLKKRADHDQGIVLLRPSLAP